MKTNYFFLILILPILAVGCAATRPVSDVAIGAGGGALANELSHGDPAMTAVGAAGGVALSESLHYAAKKEASHAYSEGYEKGRSDTVKQQYWIRVNGQKSKGDTDSNVRLYEIPIPEQTIDGVILHSTTKYLRIEE
jgi:hypothetical protein